MFAALNLQSGAMGGHPRRQHRTQEFPHFLEPRDAAVPADLGVHLMLDHDATHKAPPIQRGLVKPPRFALPLTPTSASGLNVVERWFGELTTKKL